MNQTHFLAPQKLKLSDDKNGGLFLKMDGQKIRLAPPKRALPLSYPDQFIVLNDENGAEIGVVKSLYELDIASRQILEPRLEAIYHVTTIVRVLEVEREPLSGHIRWRVEVEGAHSEPMEEDESAHANDEKSAGFRLLRLSRHSEEGEMEAPKHEITFLLAGAEDIQTGRYPRIFLSDIDGNRYEIPNSEALDLSSRRMAEKYF